MNTKTVLITGASSGIGKEFAYLFAKDGYSLILVARRRKKLEEVAKDLKEKYGSEVVVITKDLAKHGVSTELFDEVKKKNLQVDVLVNNAGFGTYGLFWENEMQKEIDMIHVNVSALTHLTRLFLPEMVERKNGVILNVASTASFQPGPMMAVYYATKSFVLHFTEAIAEELKGTGVTASALCPGPTRTEFSDHSNIDGTSLFEGKLPTAAEVAAYGYAGMKGGKVVIIPGFKNKLFVFLNRLTPRPIVVRLVKYIQRKEK